MYRETHAHTHKVLNTVIARKVSLNYRAKCLLCSWVSEWNTGPVFAGRNALRHSKNLHPESEGLVAVIEKKKWIRQEEEFE